MSGKTEIIYIKYAYSLFVTRNLPGAPFKHYFQLFKALFILQSVVRINSKSFRRIVLTFRSALWEISNSSLVQAILQCSAELLA